MRLARVVLICTAVLGLGMIGAKSSKTPTPRLKWETTRLRRSIGPRGATLGQLKTGTECEVHERSGEWVRITVSGWVPAESVANLPSKISSKKPSSKKKSSKDNEAEFVAWEKVARHDGHNRSMTRQVTVKRPWRVRWRTWGNGTFRLKARRKHKNYELVNTEGTDEGTTDALKQTGEFQLVFTATKGIRFHVYVEQRAE